MHFCLQAVGAIHAREPVTLEFSNTTPLPAKIYANEGVAKVIFIESDEVCEISYRDRDGKYQGQKGVTLPKI